MILPALMMFIEIISKIVFDTITAIALRIVFVIMAVIFGLATAAAILIMGIIIKCVGKKLDRVNLKIYSNVLLIFGGIYTVLSIIYSIYALGSFTSTIYITPEYLSEGMSLILSGTAVVCSTFVLIPAFVGVLLELIYRNTRKLPLRIISVILFVLTALALVISIALMILASYGVKVAYGV